MTLHVRSQSDVNHLKLPCEVCMNPKPVNVVLLIKGLGLITVVRLEQIVKQDRSMLTTFASYMSLYRRKNLSGEK